MNPVDPRLPLPVSELFPRLGLDAGPFPGPAGVLGQVEPHGIVLEDFRPTAESLEWRLAEHQWSTRGLLPFVDGEVPFWINNSGRLSEDAAVLLFAYCEDCQPQGVIRVLELGAGTGLFARCLLDDFQSLCSERGRDYHQRLEFWVSDRSATTVEQWRQRNLFAGHEQQVRLLAAAAEHVPLDQMHAVFANYVLDVLRATVVERRPDGGLLELQVRTRWQGDAAALRKRTGWTPQEAAECAAQTARLADIEPLLDGIDLEVGMLPFEPTPGQARLLPHLASGRQTLNDAAVELLERMLAVLPAGGFVLINDYGGTTDQEAGELAFSQRFGRTTAFGLNFPLLSRVLAAGGVEVLAAQGDDQLPIHARLLSRAPGQELRKQFLSRFSAQARGRPETLATEARQHANAGRHAEALKSYTAMLEQFPRDWALLGEVADYVGLHLNDHAAGLELARGAVQRNPWYSTWLWNIVGDCLYGQGRMDEAHQAYLQAERIDPNDARTNLNLAFTLLERRQLRDALQALARGLAGDPHGLVRDRLLAKQSEVLQALSAGALHESERQQRRAARLRGQAAGKGQGQPEP